MSSIEVLFCRENLQKFGDQAWQLLQQAGFPNLRMQVVKCIIACGECSTMLIARVNGQLVTAATAEQLVEEIKHTIRQAADA